MWFDEDIDKTMDAPKQDLYHWDNIKNEALIFGILTGIISLYIMYNVSNVLATSLLLFTILFYVIIYTIWLKRTTSLNIVIGGTGGNSSDHRLGNSCS